MCENIAASESDAPSESKSHLPTNGRIQQLNEPSANALLYSFSIREKVVADEHQNLAKRKQNKTKRMAERLNKLLPNK